MASPGLYRLFSVPGARFRNRRMLFHENLSDAGLSDRLSQFASTNRLLLNALLRQHVRLLEGPLVAMLVLPECRKFLDFSIKRKYIKRCMERMQDELDRESVDDPSNDDDDSIQTHLSVCVQRDTIFEDTLEAFSNTTPKKLLQLDLMVAFDGEEGIDEGGLTREWYGLLTREIFRPHYEMFAPTGDGVTFQINPASARNDSHLTFFHFVGQLIGRAVVDGQVLDVHFTRSFYKHILGQPVSFRDFKVVDANLYKNLTMLLKHDLEDLGLELTFSTEAGDQGGEATELLPGGSSIPVTDANKAEYVRLLCHHKMTSSVRAQIDSFLKGFYELVPPELISIFNPQELELLLAGMPDIDVDDMEAHCTYTNYQRSDSTIQHFWSTIRRFSREEKALLVQFVTGSAKVPLDGFAALCGSEGVQKMSIVKAFDTMLLPTAHTCFNQLDLPAYDNENDLREKLLVALRHGSEGFGFA